MKTENSIYHVMPTAPGRWKVIGEGSRPSFHTTEAEAVATAREWAMINEPSHVVIHKADGTIEEEHMMPMDSFPHAPSPFSETNDTPTMRSNDLASRIHEANTHSRARQGRSDGFSRQSGASA